jgi:hypothetical protein
MAATGRRGFILFANNMILKLKLLLSSRLHEIGVSSEPRIFTPLPVVGADPAITIY